MRELAEGGVAATIVIPYRRAERAEAASELHEALA